MKESDISENNKQIILRFVSFCFADGLSKSRTIRYIQNLKQLAIALEKDLNQCNKEDIMSVVAEIEMRDYSEWTRQFYKVTLKKFYAWLDNCDRGEYPDNVKWIRTSVKKNRLRTPEILTLEEIEGMIEICRNKRDKAFIAVLWESGCRLSEIMTLKKSDVQFDEHGSILMCHGKTGFRRVRIIKSAKLLSEWIRQNDSELIWTNYRGELISHEYMNRMLKRIARRVGIKKRVYPYVFRHSRATYMAQHLTEAQMKVFFGWTQDSKMASFYVHLSGRDVDKALIRLSQSG